MLLSIVSTGLLTLIFIYMFYYFCLSLRVYTGTFTKVPKSTPKVTFLVLIPAVNEEKVIATPVHGLVIQKYPKSMYDTYVIADHCTDKTAKVAKKVGAKVVTTD